MRISWDEWGLDIAEATAGRADCSRRQVGAVIVSRDNRVVATGYNGAPAGVPGCASEGACPRARSGVEALVTSYDTGAGACIALHAEQNATLRASWADMEGATMYVTCEPCPGCLRTITGTPVERVVWPEGEWLRSEWLVGHG